MNLVENQTNHDLDIHIMIYEFLPNSRWAKEKVMKIRVGKKTYLRKDSIEINDATIRYISLGECGYIQISKYGDINLFPNEL